MTNDSNNPASDEAIAAINKAARAGLTNMMMGNPPRVNPDPVVFPSPA